MYSAQNNTLLLTGNELAGINLNYGDTATIKDACYGELNYFRVDLRESSCCNADTAHPCQFYNGCAGGCEPTKAGYCSG